MKQRLILRPIYQTKLYSVIILESRWQQQIWDRRVQGGAGEAGGADDERGERIVGMSWFRFDESSSQNTFFLAG